MDSSAGRWPFTIATATAPVPVNPVAGLSSVRMTVDGCDVGAQSDDGGETWVIVSDAGQWLRCWFGGVPDWCNLRSNARRHDFKAAAAALCKLRGVGATA